MARKHDKGGRPKGDQLVGGAGRAGRGGGLATALTSSGCAEDVVGPMEEMGEDGEARYEMDPAKHAPAVRQQFLAEIKEAISNGMPVQPCPPLALAPPLALRPQCDGARCRLQTPRRPLRPGPRPRAVRGRPRAGGAASV